MKFSEVINALGYGKPITRASWEHEVYIRYSDLYGAFVMHTSDGEQKILEALTMDTDCIFSDDWMIGEFHPVKDEIKWTQTTS